MHAKATTIAAAFLTSLIGTSVASAVSAAAMTNAGYETLSRSLGQDEGRGGDHREVDSEHIVAQADPHIHDEHEIQQTHIHGDKEVVEYAKPLELPPDAKLFQVFFGSGSVELSDDAWSIVEEAAIYAEELGDFEIFIEGFTDTVGDRGSTTGSPMPVRPTPERRWDCPACRSMRSTSSTMAKAAPSCWFRPVTV